MCTFKRKSNKEIFKPEKYSFELWNYYNKLNLNTQDKNSENEELNLEN